MTYGGIFVGDSSNIIISDFTKALAFIGKGTSFTSTQLSISHPDCYGFAPYRSKQNMIAVEEVMPYEYQINSGSTEIPIVFFEPTFKTAVTRVYLSGTTYWATVVSESSILPNVYFFAPKTYSGTETFGMTLHNAAGETTFDSRNLTLAIKDIASVNCPAITNGGSTTEYWVVNNGSYAWYRDKVKNVKAVGSVTKGINVTNIAKPIVCVNSISTANLAATELPMGSYYEKYNGVVYTRDLYANGFDEYWNGVYHYYTYSNPVVDAVWPYPDRNSYGIHYRRLTNANTNTTQKDWSYQFKDWCNYRIGCSYTGGSKSDLTFSWIVNQAGCYFITGEAGYYETTSVTGSGGLPPYERYGVQNEGPFSVLISDGALYD